MQHASGAGIATGRNEILQDRTELYIDGAWRTPSGGEGIEEFLETRSFQLPQCNAA